MPLDSATFRLLLFYYFLYHHDEDAVVHVLVGVLFRVTGGLFIRVRCSSRCKAPSRGSALTGGHGESFSEACQMVGTAASCGSEVHSIPCHKG